MKKHLLLGVACLLLSLNLYSQCTGTGSQFPSTTFQLPTDNVSSEISTCNYTNEWTQFDGAVSGNDYEFSVQILGVDAYVVVSDDSDVIIDQGASPFAWTSTVNGSFRVYWQDDAACGSTTDCHVTSVTCTSCPAPCLITAITASENGDCDGTSNEYSADVIVTYSDNPSTGNLDVNGQIFAITSSPQTVTLTGLTADGLDVDITAFFTDDTGCTLTESAAFTSPANCATGCSIISVNAGTTSSCNFDGVNAVYDQDIEVTYVNPPATATLDVTIAGMTQNFAVTTSPQTVTLTGLPADGNSTDVTVGFSLDAMCTETEVGLYTAPIDCTPPANDVCGAISISCGIIDQPGTTTAGTDDNPATCGNSGDGNSAGVWYTFVGNGDIVTVTLNADPGNADDLGDSQLAIYSGSCAALDCVTGNDDSTPPGGSGSQTIFNSVVGTTYYIYVDGYNTNSGDFLISVECVTPVISDGTMGACESASSATSNGSGNKVFLTDADGDIIAGFMDSESMGTVNASVYIYDGTGSRDYASDNTAGDGFDLMDRSIVITPTTQPTNPVTVFLYFTQAEVDELLLNADGDNTAPASLIGAGLNKFQTDDCADVVNPQNLNAGELITITAVNTLAGGYEMVFSVSSFSGFVVAESNAAALPIKLDRFSARKDGRHNMIEWSTSSEINVQDHTLMKSNDAKNWEVLGIVAGELQSNTNVDYNMIDVLPFEVTYYQLMTTDIDGSTSYSPITSVTRNSERNSQFLGASPVPTRDVVNLNVYSSGDDNITITLTDISGKRLFVDNRAISSGDHQLPLDLSDMTNGIYMVTITSDFIQQTHRVIKN